MKLIFLSLIQKTLPLIFIFLSTANAQLIRTDPPFSSRLDSFSVIFDASMGNAGLAGYAGNDVYAHTGVTIAGLNWQNTLTTWSTNLAKARLTRITGDLWRLNIGNPYEYYSVDTSLVITHLNFVFRNSNASQTGRDVGGADIFYALTEPGGIGVVFTNPVVSNSFGDPARSPFLMDFESILEIKAIASASMGQISDLTLFLNDTLIAASESDSLDYTFIPQTVGISNFKIVVADTIGRKDSTYLAVLVMPDVSEQPKPQGTIDGINYLSSSSVRLSLFAPYKESVFVIGDFNDWKVNESYLMQHETVDANNVYWWIEIDNLTPGQEYAFQYLVDGEIRIADPYSELVLNRGDDQYIPEVTFPNLKAYPEGMTNFSVSVLQTSQENYDWAINDFQAPPKEELVIYELLIRDFIAAHDYQTLIDTLDYLENLGINAIELMPVNEFEGNESWGYNPSFHLALDKYYGTKNAFKSFIDSCHARGIAVILDMVLNHAFGQSPLVRLYASGDYGPPTSQNPWLNVTERHPYNVGYDFNHESVHTKYFVDRVNRYWLEEYKLDGYRFDLTKGFMQTGSFDDFNPGRIVLLKRMADEIWAFKNDAYIIFEHLGANDEEQVLADYGIMLWGKATDLYNEATMGYSSNLSWGYYAQRGWSYPHLVTYMESHDEQRLMYKNINYGNSSGDYDIKELGTAIQRNKMAAAFFFTLPGPKMIWQFGELGYDYDINYNGRTGNKPIRWDYFVDTLRKNLYGTYAALLKLREENAAFRQATSVDISLNQATKRIRISHAGLNAVIIGNFGVTTSEIDPGFYFGSTWYDYFSGDSISVTNTSTPISLAPGEFHIYTYPRLESPEINPITAIEDVDFSLPINFYLSHNYPNPFNPVTKINYQLAHYSNVDLSVYNMLGQKVVTLVSEGQNSGLYSVEFNGEQLASGVYFYSLIAGDFNQTRKMILIK